MIPEFPNFKLLELSDRDEIMKFTRTFPPYSDFNFTSLWSWNLQDKIALSQIHENLVIRLTDYITGEHFLSFLGDNSINETCDALLTFSTLNSLKTILRLIPEESVHLIDSNKFTISEDRDHFDYIYNLTDLRDYPGGKFSSKRNHVNTFLKIFPHATHEVLPLSNPLTIEKISLLLATLQKQKAEKEGETNFHDEAILKRLLDGTNIFDLTTVGISINDRLVALFISEVINTEYALGHMMWADRTVAGGLYAYLMMKNAEILSSNNLQFLNLEQDLGIENLRISKTRFRPVKFLKKYSVCYSAQTIL